jgi:hypothetical protein
MAISGKVITYNDSTGTQYDTDKKYAFLILFFKGT